MNRGKLMAKSRIMLAALLFVAVATSPVTAAAASAAPTKADTSTEALTGLRPLQAGDSATPMAWSGWESLGGTLISAPVVSSWANGRLDVFAIGTDNAVYHKWFDGGWSGWESLGGFATSAPAAVSWSNGRIDLFVRGGDNALYHKWFQ